jgi:signal transduction histidine kinase
MLERLSLASSRQRAFVADAAHELRSPLTSLRTQIEVAQATGTSDTSDLLTEVIRMSRLVDDLLLLARLDEAAPQHRELTDLTGLVRQVAARYAGGRVPVDVVAAECEPVCADPRGLTRVLANLLDNAVRYASTEVVVTVATAGTSAVLLTVTDDGAGIPAADRDRVFERFARLADARDRDSGGTGLGLSIVRELVTQQGGTVTLTDAAPSGLRVRLLLPDHR